VTLPLVITAYRDSSIKHLFPGNSKGLRLEEHCGGAPSLRSGWHKKTWGDNKKGSGWQ